ncbi:MAG TPA: PstS family phosphate ABC transporter substrate-binding protein [Phycisphaerales bacterium]|nr:PstS family phosphate ABC transporter substrate-binding protein [Phycisphaerales bacterium]
MRNLISTMGVAVLAATAVAQTGGTGVDSALPKYKVVEGVSGSIKSVGSDTMNNVMTHWQEEFKKLYPSVQTSLEGKGSSTAPPALTEGQSQFGPMSRDMKGSEIDAFEKKFGYKPVGLRAAIDALAVFVNKDCPVDEISFEQLKKIFSKEGKEMTWGDLGVTNPDWASKPIALYGRNSASGTYGYFKEHVLDKKDFKTNVKEQPGSSGVVQAIGSDKFAMGYSGIGYKTAEVKALKVKKTAKEAAIAPTAANCYDGSYPIARPLLVYVNYKPGSKLDPLRAEFIKMMFSKEGQEAVLKDGYIPVLADTAREELKTVGIKPTF